MPTVLVIDDDRTVLVMIERGLEPLSCEVFTSLSAKEGLDFVQKTPPDVILLDITLPRMTGLEVFEKIREIDRRIPVIFITADAGSETAIEAMQLGAYDYVAKPLDIPVLRELVAGALETRRMMHVPVAVAVEEDQGQERDLFVGRSKVMLEVFKEIGRVAAQDVTVLVRGESGTGKELVARALYQFGKRKDRPFMAVNCAALPDTLLESELFGHEKGSFTGADRRRIGKFEQCNGGTIFLDEIGDMASLVQAKVLRLLQEQRFERVGGNETIETDVRILAATNRPLEEMVEEGTFRDDLFYRLNGVEINLPPVRDRAEDIPLLVQRFLSTFAHQLGKPEIKGVSPESLKILSEYEWPGNIRELQSVIRQTVLRTTGPVIVPSFLPKEFLGESSRTTSPSVTAPIQEVSTIAESVAPAVSEVGPSNDLLAFVERRLVEGSDDLYAETLEMMERFLFTRVLRETDGNQTRASEILGITRGKIRDRIATFNISVDKSVNIE